MSFYTMLNWILCITFLDINELNIIPNHRDEFHPKNIRCILLGSCATKSLKLVTALPEDLLATLVNGFLSVRCAHSR